MRLASSSGFLLHLSRVPRRAWGAPLHLP
jgi:hypothetical protein